MSDPNSGSNIVSAAASLSVLLGPDQPRVLHAPYFQRRYCWERKKVEVFLEDLLGAIDGDIEEHFLGACVLHEAKKGPGGQVPLYWVIDGQQRLTTANLVLLALAKIHPEHPGVAGTLDEWTIGRGAHRRLKVSPTLNDTRQLYEIVKTCNVDLEVPEQVGDKSGDLTRGFDICVRYLNSEIDDRVDEIVLAQPNRRRDEALDEVVDSVLEALRDRLSLVEIQTPEGMDSTQVFQSINGKGQKLTVLDLVRSLMALRFTANEVEKAKTFFDTSWLPFEKKIGEANLENYLFVFSLQDAARPTQGNLYPFLRSKWDGLTADACLKELETYADAYRALVVGYEPASLRAKKFKELRTTIERLRRFAPPSVSRAYLVRVIHEALVGSITPEEAVSALQAVESFLVRRAVTGYEPTGLHNLFKGLWDTVGADKELLLENIRSRSTLSSPTDAELARELATRNFYGSNKKQFILYEWELAQTRRRNPFLALFDEGQVDHIMPRDNDGAWKSAGRKDQREATLNLIGNLVLIESAENSSKGSESWNEARQRYKKESRAKAAQKLAADNPQWTVKKIRERTKKMSAWICETWPDETSG